MSTSTLIKVGAVAVAALLANKTWSVVQQRRANRQPWIPTRTTPSTAVGKPADAFSRDAIQHDLSLDAL